jgi:hypothetical protein
MHACAFLFFDACKVACLCLFPACTPQLVSCVIRSVECPNDCNGNGRCMAIAALSTEFGSDVSSAALAGDGFGVTYTNWDAQVSRGCFCDFGYFGPDCSQRTCLCAVSWPSPQHAAAFLAFHF